MQQQQPPLPSPPPRLRLLLACLLVLSTSPLWLWGCSFKEKPAATQKNKKSGSPQATQNPLFCRLSFTPPSKDKSQNDEFSVDFKLGGSIEWCDPEFHNELALLNSHWGNSERAFAEALWLIEALTMATRGGGSPDQTERKAVQEMVRKDVMGVVDQFVRSENSDTFNQETVKLADNTLRSADEFLLKISGIAREYGLDPQQEPAVFAGAAAQLKAERFQRVATDLPRFVQKHHISAYHVARVVCFGEPVVIDDVGMWKVYRSSQTHQDNIAQRTAYEYWAYDNNQCAQLTTPKAKGSVRDACELYKQQKTQQKVAADKVLLNNLYFGIREGDRMSSSVRLVSFERARISNNAGSARGEKRFQLAGEQRELGFDREAKKAGQMYEKYKEKVDRIKNEKARKKKVKEEKKPKIIERKPARYSYKAPSSATAGIVDDNKPENNEEAEDTKSRASEDLDPAGLPTFADLATLPGRKVHTMPELRTDNTRLKASDMWRPTAAHSLPARLDHPVAERPVSEHVDESPIITYHSAPEMAAARAHPQAKAPMSQVSFEPGIAEPSRKSIKAHSM